MVRQAGKPHKPPLDRRKEHGNRGEDLAASYLRRQGLTLVQRNYRCKIGELDIIARLDDTLIFVEVRSTTTGYLESPMISVNERKQKKVTDTARWFVQQARLNHLNVRFDVVAVEFGQEKARITWIPDAFRPEPSARKGSYR